MSGVSWGKTPPAAQIVAPSCQFQALQTWQTCGTNKMKLRTQKIHWMQHAEFLHFFLHFWTVVQKNVTIKHISNGIWNLVLSVQRVKTKWGERKDISQIFMFVVFWPYTYDIWYVSINRIYVKLILYYISPWATQVFAAALKWDG